MGDVNTETNFTESMYNFFSTSTIGGAGGLMYHNLAMGPSNNQTAKVAVYDPFSTGASGADMALSAWYNYSQTPNGILDINLINNNTENDITVAVFLTDPTTTPNTYFQITGSPFTLNKNNGTDITTTDYDTGVTMNTTNFTSGTYIITFDITANYNPTPPAPPFPGNGVNGNTTTATDTDNVGAGTTRATTGCPNFDQTSGTLTKLGLVRGNINAGGFPNGIYINKRTTFTVTFN